MIAAYNNRSLAWGVPGIALQIVANVMVVLALEPRTEKADLTVVLVGVLLALVGTGLLVVGLAYYAKAKGRHPAWCLMAFASFVGLIVLSALKDLAPVETEAGEPIRISQKATASAVLSMFGMVCFGLGGAAGIIFGILALRHISRDPTLQGRGRAIFGIVLGCVELVGLTAILLLLMLKS